MLNDKEVVSAFVSYLREHGYPALKIDRIHDEENRKSSDIDAIAGFFAIEHTSVDTIANQRRDADWFLHAAGGIEEAVAHQLQYRLDISIPYEAVQYGQNWADIQKSFITWIVTCTPDLGQGVHTIANVQGIPFEFIAKKDTKHKPKLFLARIAPLDNSLSGRIREQFFRKSQKLLPYKEQGYITVLLSESNDIALMDEAKMLDAIRIGLSRRLPKGVDRLWYVATGIPEDLLFFEFTEALQKIVTEHSNGRSCL